jgi:hypothetical protein
VRTEPAPPTQSTVLYAEDHCALRWPLIFHATFWPVLLVAASIVLIVDQNPNLSYLLTIPLIGTALGIIAAVINRATGIRVTHTGVSIGGVRRQHHRRGHNPGGSEPLPPATAQRMSVFSCPWSGIRHIELVTGRDRMRELARSRSDGGMLALGTLWAPFMRAALVIQVDLSQATVPEFRPPDTRRYWFKPSRPGPYTVSPTWFAPTRHPAQLRAALSQQGRNWAGSD